MKSKGWLALFVLFIAVATAVVEQKTVKECQFTWINKETGLVMKSSWYSVENAAFFLEKSRKDFSSPEGELICREKIIISIQGS